MLISNELKYLFRQPVFLLSLILVPSIGYLFASGLTSDAPSIAAKLQLKYIAIVIITLPIYLGLLLPLFFSRDQNHNMTELIEVSAISWKKRAVAKLVVFFSVSVGIFTICLALVMLGTIEQELTTVLMWDLASSLVFFIATILIPTVALFTTAGYLMSQKEASAFTFYSLFMIIFVAYLIAASLTGNPILAGSSIVNDSFYQVMLWLDPYGLTALIADLNPNLTQTVVSNPDIAALNFSNNAAFWTNRVVVFLCVGLALVSHLGRQNRLKTTKQTKARLYQDKTRTFTKSDISNSVLRYRYDWLELTYSHFVQITTNRITLLILICWPLIIFSEVYAGINYVEPMSIKLPNSLDAINRVNDDILPFFGYVLVALWSWQIVGASKSVGFHELVAATKVTSSRIISAQLLTISALIAVLSLLTAIGCLMAELLGDITFDDIQLSIYFEELALTGLSLFLFGCICISIQHISRHRAVGTGLLLLLLIFKFTPISGPLGVTHTLWNITGSPLQQADHFWQRSGSLSVYMPYMTFWVLFALSLVLIAIFISHRGTLLDPIPLKKLPRYVLNFPLKSRLTCAAFLITTILYGLNLHAQLSTEKPLTFSDDRETWKASYETSFSHWLASPQPTLVHLDANIDIYPKRQYANFTMTYYLKNKTNQTIEDILIGRFGNFSKPQITSIQHTSNVKGLSATDSINSDSDNVSLIDSTATIDDLGLNQLLVSLNQPLQPDKYLTITMTFELQQPKLWPATSQFYIKPQMTYLRGIPLLPVIGYQPEWALRNNDLRKAYDLEPLNHLLPSERFAQAPYLLAYDRPLRYDWVTYNTQITTAADQYAIAPGTMISRASTNNRTTFIYESQIPMRPIPSWFSIPKETKEAYAKTILNVAGKTEPIEIEVYVPEITPPARNVRVGHNTHVENARPSLSIEREKVRNDAINKNMQAIRDTLKWLSNNISPYRHDQLRLFATPRSGPTGFALPQHMLIEYEVGFMSIPNNSSGLSEIGFDQRYRRAVHETAHQWFGHDIGNGIVEDSAFLVESLAKYVELVMLEKHFGSETKDALVAYEQKRYERAQRFYLEPPRSIIDATSSHQQYSQATLVFDKLRNKVGDDVIIKSLRMLWQQYGYPKTPATSYDFIRVLKENTSKNNHEFIDQLFLTAH